MSSEIVAGLLGATVAFAGTWLLQRERFRRDDLDRMRERLAVARGLRADLYVARLTTETISRGDGIAKGTEFPVALWQSQGHRLLGAMREEGEMALIQAFGRMWGLNRIIAGVDAVIPEIPVGPESLQKRIDTAIEILDRLEGEYVEREAKYLGQRWPRLKPV